MSTSEERAEQARRDAIDEADYLASNRPRPLGPGAFATGRLAPALEPDDRAREQRHTQPVDEPGEK